jgi:hypothetical protein
VTAIRLARKGARGPDRVWRLAVGAEQAGGLEFEVVFAWHPLSGSPEADVFHLDPGRMCVLLTRHRHACVVVGRAGDRDLLDDRRHRRSPSWGWDPDPVLDGWDVHRGVFDGLDGYHRRV